MNVAVDCHSLLLTKALHLFLKEKIVSLEACDFLISDMPQTSQKPVFYILPEGGNLSTSFSKSALMIALEKFYSGLFEQPKEVSKSSKHAVEMPEILEKKITALTEKFRQELIETLREHCGN